MLAAIAKIVRFATLRSRGKRLGEMTPLTGLEEMSDNFFDGAEVDRPGNMASFVFVAESAVDDLVAHDGVGIFAGEQVCHGLGGDAHQTVVFDVEARQDFALLFGCAKAG